MVIDLVWGVSEGGEGTKASPTVEEWERVGTKTTGEVEEVVLGRERAEEGEEEDKGG